MDIYVYIHVHVYVYIYLCRPCQPPGKWKQTIARRVECTSMKRQRLNVNSLTAKLTTACCSCMPAAVPSVARWKFWNLWPGQSAPAQTPRALLFYSSDGRRLRSPSAQPRALGRVQSARPDRWPAWIRTKKM